MGHGTLEEVLASGGEFFGEYIQGYLGRGEFAGDHFVEEDAEGVDIGAVVGDGGVSLLLGCGVVTSSEAGAYDGEAFVALVPSGRVRSR